MDCESDESERWEDFFGSSTDISPSVIAYYDHLSTNTVVNSTNNTISTAAPKRRANGSSFTNNVVKSVQADYQLAVTKHIKSPTPTAVDRHRNFRTLSANVQRLISHSNSALDTVSSVMNHSIGSLNEKTVHERRNRKRLQSPSQITLNATSSTFGGSKFKHPLSKNTCKLTQAGNELVIDDSDGGYVTPPEIFEPSESIDNGNRDNDRDKTPTNEQAPSEFFLAENDENLNNVVELSTITTAPNDCFSDVKEDCVCETKNFNVTIPSQLKNSNSYLHSTLAKGERKSQSDEQSQTSPTLSVSTPETNGTIKSRLYAIRALSENGIISSTPLTKPETSSTETPSTKPKSKRNGQSVGDLSRMKIRPLSSVSISSTSSTSSSGSDEHSPNQNAISYLASVESLADHSESELIPLGNSFTVRERACMEIVDSERNYVKDLGQVIKGYLNDWKEQACLKTDELNTLFGNIQQVYDFNVILLGELELSGMDPAKIAKCFIKLKDKFDAYTHYCTSYPEAISLLTTLLQASHTNALLATTQKSLQHTLPLGSYLLKPVQRILKYHLLLDNLRKHCDVPEVAQAQELMKNVARHIDQVKRSLEQQSRVKELCGILDGWLGPELTVLGDLKLEGVLMDNNKPRIVLLFQTMLIITKKKEDNRLQFKTYIHCKNLMLIEHLPGEPNSFSVIPYNDVHPNQIKLTARNRDQKRQWAQHIKQVMLAHFDIPNRAKELLFKLGEEEDRTPDKNTWKWNSNSSTTPEYLERRNQYRRSEMRYRSKKQRKIFNPSLALVEDNFDNLNVVNDASKTKALDSMIKELQQRNSTIKSNDDDAGDSASSSNDKLMDRTNEVELAEDALNAVMNGKFQISMDHEKVTPKQSALDRTISKLMEVRMYNTKTLPKRIANMKKQRSKTLKETSRFYTDLPEESAAETVLKITESCDDVADENKGRRRASMDATDTISNKMSDNLNRKLSTVSLMSPMSFTERHKNSKNKRDTDIISELLKDHKEFDRILKKPPKKLISLTDMEKSSTASNENKNLKLSKNDSFLLPAPPTPTDSDTKSSELLYNLQKEFTLPEPIYESLLRNVHVPYKFPSPVLNRSLSQPHCKFLKIKRPTEAPPKRPESDYVMLLYSDNGELKGVDDETMLTKQHKNGSRFRNSDTNISYHVHKSNDDDFNALIDSNSMTYETRDKQRGSTSSETDYSVSGSSIRTTLSADILSTQASNNMDSLTVNVDRTKIDQHHKSVDHINCGKMTSKLPERRVSDVTGMQRKSYIHKQGGRALGSRIASADYADPKTLFSPHRNQMLINKVSMQSLNPQRDSVFSLTSSNDSVNLSTTKILYESETASVIMKTSSQASSSDDSYYEKNVETCLEDDSIFRDSAIYSDDNNEKSYVRPEHIYSTISEVNEAKKPIPPPKVRLKKNPSIAVRTAPPPPLPVKPTFIPVIVNKNNNKLNDQNVIDQTSTSSSKSSSPIAPLLNSIEKEYSISMQSLPPTQAPPIYSPLTQSPSEQPPPIPARSNKNSSWVLKQIKNFEK